MRVRMAIAALGSLLLAGSALAQTEEIQKKVEKKLEGMRKEQASLEELLAQALKNNPDIRVAESKVREAEAEMYRARVNLLNRVVMQHHAVRASKAVADEAAANYDRAIALAQRAAISEAEIRMARSAMTKANAELAAKQAELDLLIGKHQGKVAAQGSGMGTNDTAPPVGLFKLAEALIVRTSVSPAMIDKVRKALDTPCKLTITGEMAGNEVLELLRSQTKDINVLANKIDEKEFTARANLMQSIPLGAVYQWAEDQLNWRFIVRNYGIVAVHADAVPPGAVLLKDVWPPSVKPRDAKVTETRPK